MTDSARRVFADLACRSAGRKIDFRADTSPLALLGIQLRTAPGSIHRRARRVITGTTSSMGDEDDFRSVQPGDSLPASPRHARALDRATAPAPLLITDRAVGSLIMLTASRRAARLAGAGCAARSGIINGSLMQMTSSSASSTIGQPRRAAQYGRYPPAQT